MRGLHIADVHLGVKKYDVYDAKTGLNARGVDYLNAFRNIVDTAISEGMDFLIVAGDLFDRVNPHPRYIFEAMKEVMRLSERGVHTVLIGGNHETPRSKASLHPLMFFGHLPNVHVATRPEVFRIGDYDFVCIPAPLNFEHIDVLFSEMVRTAMKKSKSKRRVLIAHIPIDKAKASSEAIMSFFTGNPVIARQIPTSFDYVALGHVHRYQKIGHPDADIPIYYPGSTERYDFGEENEEKYVIKVELEDGGVAVEAIPLPARKMITLVNKDCFGMTSDEIEGYILNKISGSQEYRGAIVRINLENVDIEENRRIDWGKVKELLKDAFYVQISSRTVLPRAIVMKTQGEYILPPDKELQLFVENHPIYCKRKDILLKLGREIIKEFEEGVGE
jgi:DNA repair exonuclease SbcCD nuclease subunit